MSARVMPPIATTGVRSPASAMRAMSERRDYQELLRESPEVMQRLTPEELDGCFTLDYYMKNVDYIYNRAGVK